MNTKRTSVFVLVATFVFLANSFVSASDAGQRTIAPDEARVLAQKACIFGYPLLVMDATYQVMQASSLAAGITTGNQFHHAKVFPDASFTAIVTPNADTLYSIAWFELDKSPVLLTVPETGDRYYVLQFLDAWTNVFASIGSRTTGNGEGTFLFAGPNWQGETPPGALLVTSPTSLVWLLGRTKTNGKSDYDAVHKIQEKYRLESLYPDRVPTLKPEPGITTNSEPPEMVKHMDATTFFTRLNRLMQKNPPFAVDAPLLESLRRIGIEPGKTFSLNHFSPDVAAAIEDAVAKTLVSLDDRSDSKAPQSGPWRLMPDSVGRYGTNYTLRAKIAHTGLGVNLREDAVYPSAFEDNEGRPLNGKHRYVVRFAKGNLPPVKAFWSLSMYNEKQHFVDNPINRYAIGDRDALLPDADGGLSLYLQNDSPGADKESNWLPAPNGDFSVFLRLYWPEASVLDNTWQLPSLTRVE